MAQDNTSSVTKMSLPEGLDINKIKTLQEEAAGAVLAERADGRYNFYELDVDHVLSVFPQHTTDVVEYETKEGDSLRAIAIPQEEFLAGLSDFMSLLNKESLSLSFISRLAQDDTDEALQENIVSRSLDLWKNERAQTFHHIVIVNSDALEIYGADTNTFDAVLPHQRESFSVDGGIPMMVYQKESLPYILDNVDHVHIIDYDNYLAERVQQERTLAAATLLQPIREALVGKRFGYKDESSPIGYEYTISRVENVPDHPGYAVLYNENGQQRHALDYQTLSALASADTESLSFPAGVEGSPSSVVYSVKDDYNNLQLVQDRKGLSFLNRAGDLLRIDDIYDLNDVSVMRNNSPERMTVAAVAQTLRDEAWFPIVSNTTLREDPRVAAIAMEAIEDNLVGTLFESREEYKGSEVGSWRFHVLSAAWSDNDNDVRLVRLDGDEKELSNGSIYVYPTVLLDALRTGRSTAQHSMDGSDTIYNVEAYQTRREQQSQEAKDNILVTDPMNIDQIRAALIGNTFSIRGSNIGSSTIELVVNNVQFLPDRGEHGTYLLIDEDREFPNDCYVSPEVLADAINTGQGRAPFDASTDLIFSFPQRLIDLELSREGVTLYNREGQYSFDARPLFDAIESHHDKEDPVRLITPIGDVMHIWSDYNEEDDAYHYNIEMASKQSIATFDTIPSIVGLIESNGLVLTNKISLLPPAEPVATQQKDQPKAAPAIPLTEVKLLDELLRGETLTLRHPYDSEDDEFKNILYVDPDRQDPDIVTIISKNGNKMTVEKADLIAALSPTADQSKLEYDVSSEVQEKINTLQKRINTILDGKVIGDHHNNAVELYFDEINNLMVDYQSSEGVGTSSYEEYIAFMKPLLIPPKVTQEQALSEKDIDKVLAAHVRQIVEQFPGADVNTLPSNYLSYDNYKEYRYSIALPNDIWLDGTIGFDKDRETGLYTFSSHSIDVSDVKKDLFETLYYDEQMDSMDIIDDISDKVDVWDRHYINLEEIAQRLSSDFKLSGTEVRASGAHAVRGNAIGLILPDEQYIHIDFEFNDDNTVSGIDISTDVTDKEVIKFTGTPISEGYSLAYDEPFNYDTLKEYVSKVIDTYSKGVERKEAYPDALREKHNKELADMSNKLVDDLYLRGSVLVNTHSNLAPYNNSQQISLICDNFRLDVNLTRDDDLDTISRIEVVAHNENEHTQDIVGEHIRQTMDNPSNENLYSEILFEAQGVLEELQRGEAVFSARERYKDLLDSLTPYNEASSSIHEEQFEADIKSGDILKLLGSNDKAIYVYSKNDAADEYSYYMRPEGELESRMFDSLQQLMEELTTYEVSFTPSISQDDTLAPSSDTIYLPSTDEKFIEALLQGEDLIIYNRDDTPFDDISNISSVERHTTREDLLVLSNDSGERMIVNKDHFLSAMFGQDFEATLEYDISGNLPGKIVNLSDELTNRLKGTPATDIASDFIIDHVNIYPTGDAIDRRVTFNVVNAQGESRPLSPSSLMNLLQSSSTAANIDLSSPLQSSATSLAQHLRDALAADGVVDVAIENIDIDIYPSSVGIDIPLGEDRKYVSLSIFLNDENSIEQAWANVSLPNKFDPLFERQYVPLNKEKQDILSASDDLYSLVRATIGSERQDRILDALDPLYGFRNKEDLLLNDRDPSSGNVLQQVDGDVLEQRLMRYDVVALSSANDPNNGLFLYANNGETNRDTWRFFTLDTTVAIEESYNSFDELKAALNADGYTVYRSKEEVSKQNTDATTLWNERLKNIGQEILRSDLFKDARYAGVIGIHHLSYPDNQLGDSSRSILLHLSDGYGKETEDTIAINFSFSEDKSSLDRIDVVGKRSGETIIRGIPNPSSIYEELTNALHIVMDEFVPNVNESQDNSREALVNALAATFNGTRVGEVFDDALGEKHYYEPTITGVSLEDDTVTFSLQGTTAGAFYTTLDQAQRLLSSDTGRPSTIKGDMKNNFLVLDPSVQDQYLLEEHSKHPLHARVSDSPWGDKEYTIDYTAMKGGTLEVYDKAADMREKREIYGDFERDLATALRSGTLVKVERVFPDELKEYADIINGYPLNTLVFVEKNNMFVAYGADALKAHEIADLLLTTSSDKENSEMVAIPKDSLKDYVQLFNQAAQPTLFLSPTGYGPTQVQYNAGSTSLEKEVKETEEVKNVDFPQSVEEFIRYTISDVPLLVEADDSLGDVERSEQTSPISRIAFDGDNVLLYTDEDERETLQVVVDRAILLDAILYGEPLENKDADDRLHISFLFPTSDAKESLEDYIAERLQDSKVFLRLSDSPEGTPLDVARFEFHRDEYDGSSMHVEAQLSNGGIKNLSYEEFLEALTRITPNAALSQQAVSPQEESNKRDMVYFADKLLAIHHDAILSRNEYDVISAYLGSAPGFSESERQKFTDTLSRVALERLAIYGRGLVTMDRYTEPAEQLETLRHITDVINDLSRDNVSDAIFLSLKQNTDGSSPTYTLHEGNKPLLEGVSYQEASLYLWARMSQQVQTNMVYSTPVEIFTNKPIVPEPPFQVPELINNTSLRMSEQERATVLPQDEKALTSLLEQYQSLQEKYVNQYADPGVVLPTLRVAYHNHEDIDLLANNTQMFPSLSLPEAMTYIQAHIDNIAKEFRYEIKNTTAIERIESLKKSNPDSYLILKDGPNIDVIDDKDFEIFAMNGYKPMPSAYLDSKGNHLDTISMDVYDFADDILPTLSRFTSVIVVDVAHPEREDIVIPSVFEQQARLKQDNPDAIILFKNDSVYNTHNSDADLTYKLLGITYGVSDGYGVDPKATSSAVFTKERLPQYLQTLSYNDITVKIVDYDRLLQPYIDAIQDREPRNTNQYDWSSVSFSTVMEDARTIASRLVDDLAIAVDDSEVKVNNFISDPFYKSDYTKNGDGVDIYIPYKVPRSKDLLSAAVNVRPDHLRVSIHLDEAFMDSDPSRSLDKVVIVAGNLLEETSHGRAEQVIPAPPNGQPLDYATLLASVKDVVVEYRHNVALLAQIDSNNKQMFIRAAAAQDGFSNVDTYLDDIAKHPERLENIFRVTDYRSRDKFLQDYEKELNIDVCTDGEVFYDKSELSPIEAASLEGTFSIDESLFSRELEDRRHLLMMFPDGKEREVYIKTNNDPNLEIGKDYFYIKEKHSLGSEMSESLTDLLTSLKEYGMNLNDEKKQESLSQQKVDPKYEKYFSLPIYNKDGEYDLNEKVLLSDLLHCADKESPIRLKNEVGGGILVYSTQDAIDESFTYHIKEFSQLDSNLMYDNLSDLRKALNFYGFKTHSQYKENISVPYTKGRMSSLKGIDALLALQKEVKVALEGKTFAWKDLNGDGDIDVNEVRVLKVSMDKNDRDYLLTGVDTTTNNTLSWSVPSAVLLNKVHTLAKREANAQKEDNKSTLDKQVELVGAALVGAKDNNGIWLNAERKGAPSLYHMKAELSPSSSLLLALHSDSIKAKSNNYVDFTVARFNGMSVMEGQTGVPIYFNDKDHTKAQSLFNIDQTRLPIVNSKEYATLLNNNQTKTSSNEYVDKDRLPIFDLLLKMNNMIRIEYAAGMTAHYDAKKDVLLLETSMSDRPEDIVRAIVSATGSKDRLNRDGQRLGASKDAQKQELLVVELTTAAKLLEMGFPARLSAEGMRSVNYWNRELAENPELLPTVMKDVDNALAMIHQVEQGQQVGRYSRTAATEFLQGVKARDKTLTFFRADDHYEVLGDDAIRYARILDKNCDYPNSLGQIDDNEHKNHLTSVHVDPEDMIDELRIMLNEDFNILIVDINKENHNEVSLSAADFKNMDYDKIVSVLKDVIKKDEPILKGLATSAEDPSRRAYISEAIRQQPSIEGKTLVLVEDKAHQHVDVVLPVGASAKSDGKRHGFDKSLILSSLKEEGLDDVQFYNPDGKLGFYKDDAYFKDKEVFIARMGENGMEKFSTMDITGAVSFAETPIFERIQFVRDDDDKWALYIKEEGKDSYAVYPDQSDVNRFFSTLREHPDNTETMRMELGRKYSVLARNNPELKKDIFDINTEDLDTSLIKYANIFKNKEGKIFCKAAIDGVDNLSPKLISASQWQRLWLADDRNKYKISLAAVLYADVLREQMQKRQAALPPTYAFERTQELKAKYGASTIILARVDDHYEAYDPADAINLLVHAPNGSFDHPSYTDDKGRMLHPILLSLDELKSALTNDNYLLNEHRAIVITNMSPSSEDIVIPSIRDIWKDFKKDTQAPLLLDIGNSYVSYNPDAHQFDNATGSNMGIYEIGLSFPKEHFAQTQKQLDSNMGSYAISSLSSFIDPILMKEIARQQPAITNKELEEITKQVADKPLGVRELTKKDSYTEIVVSKVERVKDNNSILRLVPEDKSQQGITIEVASLKELLRTQVTSDVVQSGLRNIYLGEEADKALIRNTVHSSFADDEGKRIDVGNIDKGVVALKINGQPTDALSVSDVANKLREGVWHAPSASNNIVQQSSVEDAPSIAQEVNNENEEEQEEHEEQVHSRGIGR